MIMEQKLCAACVALAVFALAMAVPQGTALAAGMIVRTADLCLVDDALDNALPEYNLGGIGTVAAVTDSRTKLGGGDWEPGTAWAVSLEGMLASTVYYVYNTESGASDCEGGVPGNYLVYTIPTDIYGEAFQNSGGSDWTNNPVVGDVIQICRDVGGLIPILEGVLVKGGKERNKPNRC